MPNSISVLSVVLILCLLSASCGEKGDKLTSRGYPEQLMEAATAEFSSIDDLGVKSYAGGVILETAVKVPAGKAIDVFAGVFNARFFVACARARAAAARGDEQSYNKHADRAEVLSERTSTQVAQNFLLVMYAESGHAEKAEEVLRKMEESCPWDAVYVIRAFVRDDDLANAERLLQQYESDAAVRLVAQAYMRKGDSAKAEELIGNSEHVTSKAIAYMELAQIEGGCRGASETYSRLMEQAVSEPAGLMASARAAAGEMDKAEAAAEGLHGTGKTLSYVRMAVAAREADPERASIWMQRAYDAAVESGMNELGGEQDLWQCLGRWRDFAEVRKWVMKLDEPLARVNAYCLAAQGAANEAGEAEQ